MNRLRALFGQPELQVILFGAGCVLFNWPFLGLFGLGSLQQILICLFLAWTALTFLLFLIGNSQSCSSSLGKPSSPRGKKKK